MLGLFGNHIAGFPMRRLNFDSKHGVIIMVMSKMLKFGPRLMGPKEIDGLLVPPGKAYTLLTGHLITG